MSEQLEDDDLQIANSTLDAHSLLRNLTKRERDVLAELVNGLPDKTIAKILEIQEVTVKLHLGHIYRKLGVKSRVQAVKIALELSREQ